VQGLAERAFSRRRVMLEAYSSTGRRLDPLREMQRVQADMNRMFGGLRLFTRPEFPPANIWASPEGAIITAEVPGVSPDQLDVAVHQDTVTLRGRRQPDPLQENAVVHRHERPHGPFARSFVLPFRVDGDRAAARFNRGVLTLELPRPEADKPHKIKIVQG
jgi:HSP20 family protein